MKENQVRWTLLVTVLGLSGLAPRAYSAPQDVVLPEHAGSNISLNPQELDALLDIARLKYPRDGKTGWIVGGGILTEHQFNVEGILQQDGSFKVTHILIHVFRALSDKSFKINVNDSKVTYLNSMDIDDTKHRKVFRAEVDFWLAYRNQLMLRKT